MPTTAAPSTAHVERSVQNLIDFDLMTRRRVTGCAWAPDAAARGGRGRHGRGTAHAATPAACEPRPSAER